uniref:MyTH4 domain-containing protein n=1 Tax=Ficedula albicollis TaxID=59894 RepID=A0A803VY18_FICAL
GEEMSQSTAWALGWLHMCSASLVTAEKFPEHFLAHCQPVVRLKARLCLAALMRFMGDQPKHKHQTEVRCIYEILQENLHDEIYLPALEMRGWLLLNLLTGYFLPSKILMPYATKFLQLASSDPSRKSLIFVYLLFGLPTHGIKFLLSLLQVAKELLQEICEQMGIGEQQEIEDFVLFAVRSGKMVRPIKLEEYLHDYLLDDKLVSVTLRRLIWRAPLHFDNQVYTDVHYGQVSKSTTLPGRERCVPASRKVPRGLEKQEELKEYTPKSLQASISPKDLHNHVATLLRTRQPLQPLDAKIQFIEHVMKLPFFGYTIFVVERISDERVPVPCFFGVNNEEIIVVDGTSQVCQTVLPDLQKMCTLRPISDGGLPGLELHYGSPDSPRALWVELPQAKELYHTIVSLRRGDWPRKTALFPFL